MKAQKRYIFGSILRQLWTRLLNIGSDGTMEYMESFRRLYCNDTDSELVEAFICTIPELRFRSEVYIVIDGIDECLDRPELCKEILRIVRGNVRVLVSSRHERDIDEAFQNQLHVQFTEELSHQDIAVHLEWTFENENSFKNIDTDMKKEIMEKLLSRSDGG